MHGNSPRGIASRFISRRGVRLCVGYTAPHSQSLSAWFVPYVPIEAAVAVHRAMRTPAFAAACAICDYLNSDSPLVPYKNMLSYHGRSVILQHSHSLCSFFSGG